MDNGSVFNFGIAVRAPFRIGRVGGGFTSNVGALTITSTIFFLWGGGWLLIINMV